MIIDIFIRTYSRDIEFLKYCLKSISKYVTGHRQVIVCIPRDEMPLLAGWCSETIAPWNPSSKNGYIDQQISKLCANRLTDAEYILYVDSDVVFFEPTDLSEYFIGGKPYLMKTRYELVGDAICWKECTEKLLGVELQYEYMRRIPIMFRRDTLEGIQRMLDINVLAEMDRLSEFNLIGAFAALNQAEQYHILDTELDPLPKTCAKQGWSWGGMTAEVKKDLERIINQ